MNLVKLFTEQMSIIRSNRKDKTEWTAECELENVNRNFERERERERNFEKKNNRRMLEMPAIIHSYLV